MARAVLLDRDGVLNVNRKYNVKSPAEFQFLPGVVPAIARLNRAGVKIGICTNQPEVQRGIITRRQLDAIHREMCRQLARAGAHVDLLLTCLDDDCRSIERKPAPGMLLEALRYFGAKAADTPFVGDQLTDLEAAAAARCRRVLVQTGLGRKTKAEGLARTVRPVAIYDDLPSFVDEYLRS